VTDEASEATRATWRRGSYEVVGDWFAAASRDVLVGADGPLALAGRDVLDVACGTAAVAIEAAAQGARVTGVDLTPEMLTTAAARAAASGVDLTLAEGSFEDLGRFGAFDVVASAFGVIFAADPVAVAAELSRACRPDGTVAVAAWHRDGALGGPPPAMRALLPGGGVDGTRWAEPDEVARFFAPAGLRVVGARRSTLAIPFASAAAAVDAFLMWSGPWMAVFDLLAAQGRSDDGRVALEAHLAERSDPAPGGIALRADYTVTHLRRQN